MLLSSLLTVIAVVPYFLDVAKRKTKPRIVSWAIWTLLMVIAGSAALKQGSMASAILSFSAAFATLMIVIVGYRNSDKTYNKLDVFSIVFAVIGLLLWWRFNSPLIALIMSVAIDVAAGIPTLWHSYKKPYEETATTFALSGFGAFLSLIAIQTFTLGNLIIPAYLTFMNVLFVTVILIRRAQLKK